VTQTELTRVSKCHGNQPVDAARTDTQAKLAAEKRTAARPAVENLLHFQVLLHVLNLPCLRDKFPISGKLPGPNDKDWNSPKVRTGKYGFPKYRRNKSISLQPVLFAIE